MKKYLWVCVLCCLIVGCSDNNNEVDAVLIDINKCTVQDTLFVEDYFNTKILFLDDNALIGDVSFVFYDDSKLIIFDRISSGGQIFYGNNDGSNLKNITTVGNGPGEYPYINEVFINDKYLYVSAGPELYVIDYNKSAFIKKYYSLDMQGYGHAVKNDTLYSFCSIGFPGAKNELNCYSFESNKHNGLLPFVEQSKKKLQQIIEIGQFLTISEDNHVLFSRLFENIIYEVNGTNTVERYKIKLYNTDEYIIPEENRQYRNRPKFMLDRFYETKRKLYVNIFGSHSQKAGNSLLTYNKNDGDKTIYENVWSNELNAKVDIVGMSNGYLIGSIASHQVKDLLQKAEKILITERADNCDMEWAYYIMNNVGNQLNPILVILDEY
jgi:hypothetical protein